MKTQEEIEKRIQEDVQFIISAVTNELGFIAYTQYFETWQSQGGMMWFFEECISITKEIMLHGDTAYNRWLNDWKVNEDASFADMNDSCFDWYHMNKALKIFTEKYEKDEDAIPQISEYFGHVISSFESKYDRDKIIKESIAYADKEIEKRRIIERREEVKNVVQELKNIGTDLKTIDEIVKILNQKK